MTARHAHEIEAVCDAATVAAEMAVQAGLVYVSDDQPGIKRIRRGKRFGYLSSAARPLTDATALKRIASLAIPPAYQDVWICANPRGHLQATGRDARQRKQYRYHPDWRVARDGAKFGKLVVFAKALPALRRRLKRDLALPGLPREKVLAVVVSLLDTTRVRIGNPAYARDNQSFGLTTLRNRHVQFIRDGRAVLRFDGKGGIAHEVVVDDKRLARIVRRCQQLPGQQLFQYTDESGARHAIDSDQVNAYLHATMGDDFTAKDFRTWGASLRAIALLARTPLPDKPSERAFAACIVSVVKQVAADLKNTPAVCRKSYIDPEIFVAWRSGVLHRSVTEGWGTKLTARAESMARRFLERRSRKPLQ